jgi:glycosyltransferase involved in cell wall biosynthesis
MLNTVDPYNRKLKILLLTPIYPSSDLICQTSVVHTFAKDWTTMGHRVRVIHNIVSFPRIFYFVASFFKDFIESKFGTKINYTKVKLDSKFLYEGVEVFRFPMFKSLPHGRYAIKQVDNQIEKIKLTNEIDGFIPDIIIGHWTNPQLELVPKLLKVYNSKTCLIFHDKGNDFRNIYLKDGDFLLSQIDVIGYRSSVIKKHIEANIGLFERSFICHSGLSKVFLENSKLKVVKDEICNYVFVGDFFERKNPIILLQALDKSYNDQPFVLDYVGTGYEKNRIIRSAKKMNQFSKIKFHGKLSQDSVRDLLFGADCFIMLSKNETFGLVYLEAMALGCLTVCSKNEGIDGIIVHGENGFLCEEGNVSELSCLINTIKSLSLFERKRISDNAIATTKKFSSFEVAKKYLNYIVS